MSVSEASLRAALQRCCALRSGVRYRIVISEDRTTASAMLSKGRARAIISLDWHVLADRDSLDRACTNAVDSVVAAALAESKSSRRRRRPKGHRPETLQ